MWSDDPDLWNQTLEAEDLIHAAETAVHAIDAISADDVSVQHATKKRRTDVVK